MSNKEDFYNGLKIKLADYVIDSMGRTGHYDVDYLIKNADIKVIDENITDEQIEVFNSDYRGKVWIFLIDEEYIVRIPNDYPSNTIYSKLTDLGKKVKKRGGHNAYLKYDELMDKMPHINLKWTKISAVAAIIAVIVVIWDEFKGCEKNQLQPIHRDTTITIRPTVKTKLDTSK